MNPIVAVGQMNCQTLNIDANMRKMEGLIQEAAKRSACLISLPELCLIGCFGGDKIPEVAQTLTGSIVQELSRISRDNQDILIQTSIPVINENGGKPYNTAILVGPSGVIASYRKMHLWSWENQDFLMGEKPCMAETPLGKIGMMICFDICFPEMARTYTLGGADLLVSSSAFGNHTRRYVFDTLTQARAIENTSYILNSNLVGPEKDHEYCGGSCIFDPMGHKLACCEKEEGVVCAAIDAEFLKITREKYPYLKWNRGDAYKL